MQPLTIPMRRESPHAPPPAPGRAGALPLVCGWPFPAGGERTSPEMRRAALDVLRTTARDWGLAAR
jgi:hypothetical protein